MLATVELIESQTPAAPSTDHTMKTATKVTTPKATESRNDGLHHRPRVDPGQPQPGAARLAAGRRRRAGACATRPRRWRGAPRRRWTASSWIRSVSGASRAGSPCGRAAGSRGALRHGSTHVLGVRRGWHRRSASASCRRLSHLDLIGRFSGGLGGRRPSVTPSRAPRALLDPLGLDTRATTATRRPPWESRTSRPSWSDRSPGTVVDGAATTCPPVVIQRISSPSMTMNAPTRPPRSSLANDIALMPRPPRDWGGTR